MNYSFHPEAIEEYLDAVSYYADINPQLAKSFIKVVETGIEDIVRHPEAWQSVEEDIRRHIVKRFPFSI